MKISIINGSPKVGKSNSEILGNYLFPLLKENNIKKTRVMLIIGREF